jgi:hypothetical protein
MQVYLVQHFQTLKVYNMKKLLFVAALLTGFTAIATPLPTEISEKVLKAFQETFANATDVTWHEYEKYAQANFKQDDVQIKAQFSEDGTLIKTYRYYTEKQLLPNIVAKLRKRYGNKEIAGVTELTSDDEVSFVINLRDDKNYYIVKSDIYGNLQQTDKYKRADG